MLMLGLELGLGFELVLNLELDSYVRFMVSVEFILLTNSLRVSFTVSVRV